MYFSDGESCEVESLESSASDFSDDESGNGIVRSKETKPLVPKEGDKIKLTPSMDSIHNDTICSNRSSYFKHY